MITADPNKIENLAISQVQPIRVEAPSREEECAATILECASRGEAIVPVGGLTAVKQGNPLTNRNWVAVQTKNLGGIVDFSPADMVVCCRAGATIREVQTELLKANQFLPLDPPFSQLATLGGVVATNANGLWRPSYGIPRDRLLGLRVVMADGSIIKAGGKVVKNVAGYDLCKLFAGSWGTLGLITEVTFKTSPLPQTRKLLYFQASDICVLASAGLDIHLAKLQPAFSVVMNGESSVLVVGLMGSREQVDWQADQITAMLDGKDVLRSACGPPEDEIREYVCSSPAELHVRFSVKPSEAPSLISALQPLKPECLLLHSLVGIVEASFPSPSRQAEAIELLGKIRSVSNGPNRVTFLRVSESQRDIIGDIWGANREDFFLHERIKRALDPRSVFSPGRFLGGL